jgi:RNA polymerase sigma-70 factor, ECF subfamily
MPRFPMSSSTAEPFPNLALDLEAADGTSAIEADVLRLFDECASSLTRYVRASGLSSDAADDVVQETFLALFRHLCLGRSRENLRGWLFTVAWRLALKQRARAARRRSTEAPLEAHVADSEIDLAENPETRLATRRYQDRLRSAVSALPERHRQCLFLRAEGLRYREIAGVLGISLGGVAKTLAYAIVRLSHVPQE